MACIPVSNPVSKIQNASMQVFQKLFGTSSIASVRQRSHYITHCDTSAGSNGSGVAQVLSVEGERHTSNQSGQANNGSSTHSSSTSNGNGNRKDSGSRNANSIRIGKGSKGVKKKAEAVSLFGSFKAPVKQ